MGNTDTALRSRLLEHLATRCLVTKPVDAADARGQLPQLSVSFPNQPILPKPAAIPVSSPANFSFLPQSSPRVLPAAQYHLAYNPLTNGKVAVLLPTVNPFLMDSSSAGATQPSLIPVYGKDPKHGVSPPEVMPLGLDTRSLFWKPWFKNLFYGLLSTIKTEIISIYFGLLHHSPSTNYGYIDLLLEIGLFSSVLFNILNCFQSFYAI